MAVTVEVDYREWDRAMVALQNRIIRSTYTATDRGMLLIEHGVKGLLRLYTHPRGTPTPSPPGHPPALVSGNLRRSWRTVPAHAGRRPHTVEAHGGPTAAYARIQELGGEIVQQRTRTIRRRNSSGGQQVRTQVSTVHIRLPARPSVRPALRAARRQVRAIYISQWTQAIRGA